ncbi:hypothetical protein [Ectopseudomonas mendocina]|nr:hypothetical protein [Pseudomonas mendocina]
MSFALAVALCFAAATISSCVRENTKNELETINKAIEAGQDPLIARCAIEITQSNEDVCTVAAALAGKKLKGVTVDD